jgi:vacuolar-type H+-ATPase subunit H
VSRKDRFRNSRTPAREAAERIEAVVEAAERAAETVIDDAEKRAHSYLANAEADADRLVSRRLASLSELTDALFTQADEIHRQTENLLAALERAKAEIGAEAGAEPMPPPLAEPPNSGRGSHLTAVAEPEDPQPRAERGTPAGARLLATQMAVSGNSREEIELRLRSGFEIEDTTAILDAILGPEE